MNAIPPHSMQIEEPKETKEIIQQINEITQRIKSIIEYRGYSRIKQSLSKNPEDHGTLTTLKIKISRIQIEVRNISDESLKIKIGDNITKLLNKINELEKH